MTVKTRSSANYSYHMSSATTTIPTTTANRDVVDAKSSSQKISSGADVDAIMAAKNEANQKFLRSYQAHLQTKFVFQARQWLTAFKYTGSEIDEIIASFHIHDINLESKDDENGGEGCNVFSPVKKKQKSNDYTSTTTTGSHVARGNNKVLLPPTATTSQQPKQKSIINKYGHILHGLSVAEVMRIETLKKNELISEIDHMDGEYHKSWTKPMLVDTLLRTYASFHQPQTQAPTHLPVVAPPSTKSADNDDDDAMIVDAPMVFINASTEHNLPAKNVEVARTNSADSNNMKKQPDITKNVQPPITMSMDEDIDESSIPVVLSDQHPSIDNNNDDGNDDANIDFQRQIQQVSSSDSDETHYDTARENPTAESQSVQQKSNVNTKTLVLTKQHGSSTKSSVDDTKLQHKTRVSPTTVPPGIVDSAKKALMLSSQKNSKAFQLSNVHQQQPIGRVLYKDPQCSEGVSTTPAILNSEQSVEHQKAIVKYPNTTSSNTSSGDGSNRILSTPAYSSNSNGSTMGMSQKVQASNEARQAYVAQMKEKSKQTLLTGKKYPPTGTTEKSTILSNSERIRQHQQMQQNFVNLTTSTPSVAVPSQKHQHQSVTLQTTQVDTVKSKTHHNQNPAPIFKTKSPIPMKQPVFTSYEMTDGEYDSDDDEDDVTESNKKMIPDWARSRHLEKALEIQFSKTYPLDPDVLFGEVETCNLEAIFGKRSSKYRNRNSSGDWTKDRVTIEEKRLYKLQIA